jgi:hypothetical protein
MKKSTNGRRIPVSLASAEPSDAFFLAEGFLKGTGSAIGLKPKKNELLATTQMLATKLHATRSPMRHTEILEHHLTYHGHPFLEVRQKILQKRLKYSY